MIFKQIVGAVAYCHSYGVAHRDLKPENILFSKFPTVKITDFGLCGYVSEEKLMKTFCGSPCYCAPECLCKIQYDGRLADVWSLGVVLYSMVTGEHPWNVTNTSMMLRQIMAADFTLPLYLSEELRDLISRLMKVNPNERIPLHQVLKHPWLNFAEWSLIKQPENLDLAISSITPQPMTLEQISSSSSRSSHLSDHGIISPFEVESDGNLTDDDEPISLASFVSGNQKKISASMNLISTKAPLRRRIGQNPTSSRGKMATIFIPQVKTQTSLMVIKEVPQENSK